MTPQIKIKRVKVGRSWWPSNWPVSANPATRMGVMQKSVTCRLKCGGAPSCCGYVRNRVTIGTSSRSKGSSFCKKLRYIRPVRRPSKMWGEVSLLEMMPHYMFIENLFWKLRAVVLWGLSGDQECVLLTPSRVNRASSINKTKGHSSGWAWIHLQNWIPTP
jgi:hypothetical protein